MITPRIQVQGALLSLLCCVACAQPMSETGGGPAAGSGNAAGAPAAGGSGGASSSGGSGGVAVDVDAGSGGSCTPGAEQLMLLGFDLKEPVLYAFDPKLVALEELGPIIGCPSGSGFEGRDPWGAALARDAVLWTHYLAWDQAQQKFTFNEMFAIDTTTGNCSDLGPGPQHSGDKSFEYGLAFLPPAPGGTEERLFGTAVGPGAALQSFDLAELDPLDFGASQVGPLEATLHSYLASSGDGRLFTLYQGPTSVGVRELDPATGSAKSEQPIASAQKNQPWGPFAFWGGDLWVFQLAIYSSTELRTDVFRLDGSTWTASQVMSLDFVVTAASSSTCAPIEPPK